jgi:hypothetical protein
MLLNNQFKIFSKSGNNINSIVITPLTVDIIDPLGTGKQGEVRAYTDYTGVIQYVQIINAGFNYSNETYLRFQPRPAIYKTWNTDPSLLIKSVTGELIGFNLPFNDIQNTDWPYASTNTRNTFFLPPVSAGLIESENLFIIEKVLDSQNNVSYTFPRVDEYGPFYIQSGLTNGSATVLTIAQHTSNGLVNASNRTKIINLDSIVLSNVTVGMTVSGTGIVSNTKVVDVNPILGEVILSKSVTSDSSTISYTFYTPHNLKVGSKINLSSGPLAGEHLLTQVTPYTLAFNTDVNTIVIPTSYTVIPQFSFRLKSNSDPEFFVYTVEYGVDYPTIQKSTAIAFEITDGTLSNDTIVQNGNGEVIRKVNDFIHKKSLQLNFALQADVEGVYAGIIEIADTTFTTGDNIIFSINVEGEVIAEDERLGSLLQNFGRDITTDQELILRDSDVNEDNPDFILLNQKRKEMLLQGEQIWPYVGSYKGLVNIINWFGYYDIRIKEYWLNVNMEDAYYNKYRQVPIAFQLKDKTVSQEQIGLVPSKHYKKSNLFGLYYDIVKDSINVDEYGIPLTEDSFAYTNEEVLIKLFALKGYLKQKFLPLNTRIVDITGEGVYYERYAVNTWSDRNDRQLIQAGKRLDFTSDKRSQIIDLRPYDANGGLLTPEVTDSLSLYADAYDINDVIMTSYGGNFFGEIPTVTFPGQALQQAKGKCRVRGMSSYQVISTTISGANFLPGDIITLSGGTYDVPLRIEVAVVNGGGSPLEFIINAGPQQGSNYTALPSIFGQGTVVRPVGNQYVIPNDTVGFQLDPINIPFEVEEVTLYDLGRSYSAFPDIQFLWSSPTGIAPVATLKTTRKTSSPVSYYSDNEYVKKYADSPDISIGALVNVSTTFDVTWDELIYPWSTFSGSNDATLKSWTRTLPGDIGELAAVEIISQGTGYNYTPTFKVFGGGGFGATVQGQIKNGQLNIVEYTVVSINTGSGLNDILTLSPAIPAGGLNAISVGRIVKGNGIPDGTIISQIISGDIWLESYNTTPTTTSINIGDKVYIHQGVGVTSGGAGYTSNPLVSPNGGHTTVMYTWNELGRGDFYQMEWKATLTQPTDPTKVYKYKSGVNTIDELINHTMILPYTGKYTIELDVYDTNNCLSNKIRRDVVEVYMPEADFAFISKNVDDCKDTWNEFAQIQPQDDLLSQSQIEANTPLNLPSPIKYDWDHANSQWINITFNQTLWDDCDINWDTLVVTDLSDVNMPSFPLCKDIQVLQISAEDVLEGAIVSYSDSTTFNPTVNPTIVVAGQLLEPKLDPTYDPTDWIYIRRDGVTYQLDILAADYSVVGQTSIELASTPPKAFTQSPQTWEVLREIGGTVAVDGNLIYDAVTNPNGFRIGEYLILSKSGSTPLTRRNVITFKDTDNSFDLLNGASDINFKKQGAYGRVYKVRDYMQPNGNLNWTTDATAVNTFTFGGSNGGSSIYSYTNVAQTSTSGSGINSTWNVEISTNPLTAGQYINVTVANAGSGFAIGDVITIDGTSLGSTPADDLTITVTSTILSSGFQFINSNPTQPDVNDHICQLVLNPHQITCDPLAEMRPGFTRITLHVFNGAQEIYSQIFRTKHVYLNNSTLSTAYNIWNTKVYTIDVIGLNGGNLSELPARIANYYALGPNVKIYLEYEYDDFTTRERFAIDNGSDVTIIPNYNSFPAAGSFINGTNFGPTYTANHTNWFYDHGIVSNSYSMKILNTGTWRNGLGTLITLEDNNVELYRCDTFFLACQQEFDEDYAETHLGTRVQNWRNYSELTWETFCGNTYDTLDYSDSLWCGYIIDTVNSNGGIKFNELPTFNFKKIIGGMSSARKFVQAWYELNSSNNPGISKFDYVIYSDVNNAILYVENGYVDFDYVYQFLTSSLQYIGNTKINTYLAPNAIFYDTSVSVSVGDVLYSKLLAPDSVVTSIAPATTVDPTLTNYNVINLSKVVPKKARFSANGKVGEYNLKNIQGLHEGDIRVGETVTGSFLPAAPLNSAKVLQIFSNGGMVREIILDKQLLNNVTNGNYAVEQVTLPNATITIPFISKLLTQADLQIIAFAKTPSVDNLGYLKGTKGVKFLPPQSPKTKINTTLCHTFPMGNFYKWFGFGENKVGSFEHGLQEFLTKYRYAQVYLGLGTSPIGEPGWYPANELPYKYSYTNDPVFSNYLEAKSQSQRLPYARSIGGAYTWEETRIGKQGAKIPSGSSVMLSAEASNIVGKSGYLWKLKEGEKIIAETIDSRILWTFDYTGNFDIELTITDANGNQRTGTKKSFLNIYEAI